MKENFRKISVFVSNPSDANKYKAILKEVAGDIENKLGEEKKFILKVIDFQSSVVPYIGPTAQTVINDQTKYYDVFIGIYCGRFGSPTGNLNTKNNTEYESGSEEEFNIALEKFHNDKIPISLFFNKRTPNLNSSKAKIMQYEKLIDFKDTLKQRHQFLVEFNSRDDFRKKVYVFLYDACNNILSGLFYSELSQQFKIRRKRDYEPIEEYLSRTVVPYKDVVSSEYSYISFFDSKDLVEVIKKENRVVLLADAGYGKSVELQRLGIFLSREESKYYPMLVKLNTYTNDRIENLFESGWNEVPEQSLVLLFDALDEVEGKYRNTIIKELERFSDEHSHCKIIISCRTNFYVVETEDSSGSLKGFSTYLLNSLEGEEIEKFLTKKLGIDKNEFYDHVKNNKTSDLLDNPFYLRFLVEKYKSDKKLPATRAEMFEELIKSRIYLDEGHFRTSHNYNLLESREIVLQCLMKLALSMEILGKNYITVQEYLKIIPDESMRRLLEQKTLWNNRTNRWQFEHNSFQEYLAAKVLSFQSLEIVKKIIALDPSYKIIIPSWLNTLSFLLNLYEKDDLRKWILDIQPELTIKFEPNRVSRSLRTKIFIEIFENYEKKKIWIDHDKFNIRELAKFGEGDEVIKYLLKHIEISIYHTIVGNAIILLSRMEIPLEYKEKIIKSFLNISVNYKDANIQNYAIIGLSLLDYVTKEIIDYLMDKLGKSTNDYIRYGMYSIIENSEFLNEYIDYFLDGIKYADLNGRVANESWHLENGLKKASSQEAMLKILEHFIENPDICHKIGFDRVLPVIMKNATDIYLETKNESIFNNVKKLYILLQQRYFHKEAKFCIEFFNRSNTRTKLFRQVYQDKSKYKLSDLFSWLAYLSDYNCTEIVIAEYREHNITNDDVWIYQNFLDNSEEDLYQSFNKRINEASNNKFEFKPQRDFEQERKIKFKKDLESLFNNVLLLDEIKSIFNNEKEKLLTSEIIRDIEYYRWREKDYKIYSHFSLDILSDLLEKEDKSYEQIHIEIDKIDWENYSVEKIYNYIENNVEYNLTNHQKDCLEAWCLDKIPIIDFNNAVVEENNSFSVKNLAIYLWTFLREFKFKFPKSILLDMISFDWHGVGIDYLEEFLSLEDIKNRIFQIFRKEIKKNTELRNCFKYCFKHRIKSSKRFAEIEILDSKRNIGIREQALELLTALGTNNQKLLNLLKRIEDPFRWNLVELLLKRSCKKVTEYLISELKKGTEETRLKSAFYLMSIDNIKGLEYYTKYLVTIKEFFPHSYRSNPFPNIRSAKAIPFLIKLLKLSYDKELKEDRFESLYRAVENILSNIALTNERKFNSVVKSVNTFIYKNKEDNDDVNFLYTYLERLERQFYFSKSKNITINDVLTKLKTISYSNS